VKKKHYIKKKREKEWKRQKLNTLYTKKRAHLRQKSTSWRGVQKKEEKKNKHLNFT
jgi:hypothetical protein